MYPSLTIVSLGLPPCLGEGERFEEEEEFLRVGCFSDDLLKGFGVDGVAVLRCSAGVPGSSSLSVSGRGGACDGLGGKEPLQTLVNTQARTNTLLRIPLQYLNSIQEAA